MSSVHGLSEVLGKSEGHLHLSNTSEVRLIMVNSTDLVTRDSIRFRKLTPILGLRCDTLLIFLSFTAGTSSTLFSAALTTLTTSNASSVIVDAIQSVLADISDQDNDIASYPNPFANWNSDSNPVSLTIRSSILGLTVPQISNFEYITLVDAGLTNQNIPIEPLLIPYRNVDAIIAFDSSADTTYSWPNGTALRQTYERAEILAQTQDVSIRMPKIPSANGFVNGGLNQRPTVFGCDAQNGSTPLIVYIPNYPWSYYGNTSTVSPFPTLLNYNMADVISINSTTRKPNQLQ